MNKTSYTIRLINNRIKQYRFIREFVLLFSVAMLLLVLARTSDATEILPKTYLIIVAAIYLLWIGTRFIYKKKQLPPIVTPVVFMAIGACWLLTPFWWMAFIMPGLYLLDIIANRPWEIRVTENGISLSSFPVKKIHWSQLNQVILKDNLLTIDHKNNQLFQQLTDTAFTNFPEKEFNAFCAAMLDKTT